MGIKKTYQTSLDDAGRRDLTESISSTGASLLSYGLSVISTTGNYSLGKPQAGLHKFVVAQNTLSVTGNGATINASTAQAMASPDALHLVGLSTGAWAIVSLTTA